MKPIGNYRPYLLEPPKFFVDQHVKFTNHRGTHRYGTIIRVETHYDCFNIGNHIYTIYIQGHERHIHIGESKIIYVVTEPEEALKR